MDTSTSNNFLHINSKNKPVVSCIRLDGRCVFKVAFAKSESSQRASEIQYRLDEIKNTYLQQAGVDLQVSSKTIENNTGVYVTLDRDPIRLLSVTLQDATAQGLTVESKARLIAEQLESKLLQAREHRKPEYLLRQGIISLIILVTVVAMSILLRRLARKSYQRKQVIGSPEARLKLPLVAYFQKRNTYLSLDIKHRFFQIAQPVIILAGILVVLGLFPQLKPVQIIMITAIRLPLRVAIIGVLTYLLIRLIFRIVNSISSSLTGSQFVLSPTANKRLELRVKTISLVIKGVLVVFLTISGFLTSLAAIGIDIAPFLAGAGIIGLAISFASQSFIKDALNGFLIIFEDQYAVGDVINLNGVGGMVEYINLRITKIRDAEGRLITIPNSEVKIVANLSSQWSRADLNIPLDYDVDLDLALAVITQVANTMSQAESWQEFILEPPLILGVDQFSDRGIIVRIFIKTEPLKQFDVSREFRRRLQIALKEAGIPLLPPQRQILLEQDSK